MADHHAVANESLVPHADLLNHITDAVFAFDTNWCFTYLNEPAETLHEHPADELLGECIWDVFPEARGSEFFERYHEAMKRQEQLSVQIHFEAWDRWYEEFLYPSPDGLLVVSRDITEQVTARQRLSDYKRAIESASDLIIAVDLDERCLFANQAYLDYLGLNRDETIGEPLREVLDDSIYQNIEHNVEAALSGEMVHYRMSRPHSSESERVFDIRYYPLRFEGEITGAVGILRDVTGREERNRHLLVLNRVLRHNLRNDLTVISGLAEHVSETADTAITEAAEKITGEADDLLAMSEKGRVITTILTEQPRVEAFDLIEELDSIVSSARKQVSTECPESLRVRAIPQVTKAFEELLENAFTHTDQSDPTVSVTVTRSNGTVQITIADDGPGIDDAHRAILESGNPPSSLAHGSGLGVWLVYWAVRRSRGDVLVQVGEPRGTRITVELMAVQDGEK